MTPEQREAWRRVIERAFEIEAGSPVTIQDELDLFSAMGSERFFKDLVDADDHGFEEEDGDR